jgi:hypothetical protein
VPPPGQERAYGDRLQTFADAVGTVLFVHNAEYEEGAL